jgi:hypothetical protein
MCRCRRLESTVGMGCLSEILFWAGLGAGNSNVPKTTLELNSDVGEKYDEARIEYSSIIDINVNVVQAGGSVK